MTESEFNQVLEKNGMSLVRPVHPCGQGWGQVNMPDGSVRDRWRGGTSLKEQAAYLVGEAKALAAPQAKKPRPSAAADDLSGESLRAAVGKALQASSSSAQGDNAPKKTAKAAVKKATKNVVKKAVKKVVKKGAQK